ncbi:MAG TPA: cation:proton antiporter [Acidimicrobiales bacterium]|nr:cation:proton antiporter [Acidimicrobiales bacterium]
MTEVTAAVLCLLVFVWAVLSGVLARHNLTGSILLAAAGYVLGNPDWGSLHVEVNAANIHVVAEITLALVLFSDAARVDLRSLRADIALPARLLGIGLPLSVVAGFLLAMPLLAGVPWALALFVGAALAPTDAALSTQVIDDERIPMRLRRALNVESGLNDGIVTPIVTLALAVAASQLAVVSETTTAEANSALRALAGGLAFGAFAGVAGAVVITAAARYGWVARGGRRVAALAVALGSFAGAVAFDANGFIAAFVAGMAFGAVLTRARTDVERVDELPDLGGRVLGLVVWFLFGATLLPVAFHHLDARMVVYAVLSLTVVRMAPVALSLVRSRLDGPTVAFVGWFGPRGLASVVFALLALESLGEGDAAVSRAVGTVALTVMLSVVLHGVTAGPAGRSYLLREAARR